MELADILAEEAVLDCTGVTSKRQLFDILSKKASEITGKDQSDILTAIAGREELGSTAIADRPILRALATLQFSNVGQVAISYLATTACVR